MNFIDGKLVAANLRKGFTEKVAEYKEKTGKIPGLAVIIVGNNPASEIYVRNKINGCAEVGVKSFSYALPEDTDEATLLKLLGELNENPEVNGILVQLPLPKTLNEQKILAAIAPKKDVDGFSSYQMGRLALGLPALTACTPSGVIEMLKFYNIGIAGKRAVVVGRSNIVGKPMALLLLQENATVTVCHSRTKDLPAVTREADIIVVAIGRPEFLTADMVKDGAVVIDVGTTRTENGLKGDVKFDEVSKKASYISPVPGGVGPMTITMLLGNTLKAFEQQNDF